MDNETRLVELQAMLGEISDLLIRVEEEVERMLVQQDKES